MMVHVAWHFACGAFLSSEESVDGDHGGDALVVPKDELDVDDHVRKHSHGGAVLKVRNRHK